MDKERKYKLEDFIEKNRVDLNAAEMPNIEHIWGQIKRSSLNERDQLQHKKIVKLKRWVWGLAASVIAVSYTHLTLPTTSRV